MVVAQKKKLSPILQSYHSITKYYINIQEKKKAGQIFLITRDHIVFQNEVVFVHAGESSQLDIIKDYGSSEEQVVRLIRVSISNTWIGRAGGVWEAITVYTGCTVYKDFIYVHCILSLHC